MSDLFEVSEELGQFSGQAPLFPLPNAVHFPHAWLPLHIFEARYRQMIADVLEGDRLIAMAFLRPNWETTYDTKLAQIHPIVCLGHIAVEERLTDGRFNLALRGLSRARIEYEIDTTEPYRVAKLTLLSDQYPTEPTIDRRHRQRELLTGAIAVLPELQSDPLLHQLLEAELPLGVLCDVITHALGVPPDDARLLLEETNVDLRSELVLSHLHQRQHRQKAGVANGFPPAFSLN
ncbi:MAG: LON peptidase substrate-binding domain-containing protein [Planctomycetia bacterium]|nr:LON peptidase substrate-binding domain-containing protein [Planctomycetia bacterium]